MWIAHRVLSVDVADVVLAYWIAFGPHGPRTPRPADFNWRVFKEVMKYIGISAVIFALTRYFANPPPRTMNKEWQEASNAYLKVRPFLGSYLFQILPIKTRVQFERVANSFVLVSVFVVQKQKAEPITGYSSPDYKGKGLIQSPLGKTPKPMEE